MSGEKMVSITQAEYDSLVKDSEWLSCLEAAGVDNWQGIDEAHQIYGEWLIEQGLEN